MPKRYSSEELMKMIEADGWVLERVKGSHHHFHHPKKPGLITIVHPEKDTPQGTANKILKQAGKK